MVKLHFEAQQSRLHPKHPFRQLSFGCGGKKHKKPTHRTIGWVFVFYFWALIFLPQTYSEVQKFADNLINYSPNAADGLFGIPAKNRKGCRLQVGEWRYVSTNLSNLFSWDFFSILNPGIKTQRWQPQIFSAIVAGSPTYTFPRSSKNSTCWKMPYSNKKEVFLKHHHFQVHSRFF